MLKLIFSVMMFIIPTSCYAVTVSAVVPGCHVYSIGHNTCQSTWHVDPDKYRIDWVVYKGSLNVKGLMNFPWASINSSSSLALFPSANFTISDQASMFVGYNKKKYISQFGPKSYDGTIKCIVDAFGILDEAYADCSLRATVFYSEKEEPPTPEPGIPEPDTWSLLMIGFAATGVFLRRRHTSAIKFAD